jgi:RNA polymerase sigma-B factor
MTVAVTAAGQAAEQELLIRYHQSGDMSARRELVERSRDALATAWRRLPPPEQPALELRFVHSMTQREIGEIIGFSQMHVSRLLRRALTHLERATA